MTFSRLIFGCGYLGARVARLWQAAGDEIHVVTRSHERAAIFQREGWNALVADVTRPTEWPSLPCVDTVLFAVGSDRNDAIPMSELYAGGVRNVLDALRAPTRRFLYISSTGVYGPAAGDWVDESTPPNPQRAGGIASLAAEHEIAASPMAQKSVILRMAGLYGPQRIPFAEKLRRNEPLEASSEGWLNLIHIDDAAQITTASSQWTWSSPGPLIVCVSDGCPVRRADYYRSAAQMMGAREPQFVAPPPQSPSAARAAANRRIRPERLRRLMADHPLLYPTYREGLAADLAP